MVKEAEILCSFAEELFMKDSKTMAYLEGNIVGVNSLSVIIEKWGKWIPKKSRRKLLNENDKHTLTEVLEEKWFEKLKDIRENFELENKVLIFIDFDNKNRLILKMKKWNN